MKVENRMTILVVLALMIVVLAARLLYLVDASLRAGDGYGFTGDGAIQTVPLFLLLIAILWLITGIFDNSPLNLETSDKQTIGIISLMFVIGFYFGPSISIPNEIFNSNVVGIIIIIIPIIFISAMFNSIRDSVHSTGKSEGNLRNFGLNQLRDSLKDIIGEWHDDPRDGNDGGAGNLLEDLLGIEENNLSIADYGIFELKTQRRESASLVTLFHADPYPRPFDSNQFLDTLGWPHSTRENCLRFSSTTQCDSTTRGFYIHIEGNRLNFAHNADQVSRNNPALEYEPYETLGDYSDLICANENYQNILPKYWVINPDGEHDITIYNKLQDKLQNVVFVEVSSRRNNGIRQHRYERAWIFGECNLDCFLDLVNSGDILVDFDLRTGHNHGTKFRIRSNRLSELFENSNQLC